MTLNELKRLNNILYRYTGLGKIEKCVDDFEIVEVESDYEAGRQENL